MKRQIDHVVIHCTATPQSTTVESIINHWKNTLNWKSVGYHFLIEQSGRIHTLASFDEITNGVKGYNSKSIHISDIGGAKVDDRTEAQKKSIIVCIERAFIYAGGKVKIQGHRDFPNVKKECPRFDAQIEYKELSA